MKFFCSLKIAICISCLALLSACSSDHSSYSCDKYTDNVLVKLSRIVMSKSPWTAFPYREYRLVVVSQARGFAYFIGFKKSELEQANLQFSLSKVGNTKFFVTSSDNFSFPSNEIFDIAFPKSTAFSGGADPTLVSLANASGLAVTSIFVPLRAGSFGNNAQSVEEGAEKDFLCKADSELWTLRIATHEPFHGFQFSPRWGLLPYDVDRDFYAYCAQSSTWLSAYIEEVNSWLEVLPQIDSLNRAQLSSFIGRIVGIRNMANSSEDKFCWNAHAFWEREEGTARYQEYLGAENIGLISTKFINQELKELLLESVAKIPTSDAETDFYSTGHLICKILDRLYPREEWQARVEQGQTPFAVLADSIAK